MIHMVSNRPRLSPGEKREVEDVKKKLKYLEAEKGKDVSKYKGKTEEIKTGKIIEEGMKALKEKGLP